MVTKTLATFSRILVPTDFSRGAELAWDLAQGLAETSGAELWLVHALPTTPIDLDAQMREAERQAEGRARAAQHQLAILRDDQLSTDAPPPPVARVFHGPLTGEHLEGFSAAGCAWAEMLERWAAQGHARGCKVHTELRTGAPAPEILAAATEHEADLVVIANHGHGHLHGLLIGSVADRVIRMAPCPVLTVKTASSARALGESASG
jgi:nucleotide-binding universal stress UspA family protein